MSGRASDPAEQMVRPTPPMRLMIVDDHEIVRQGLIATLGSVANTTVLGAVSTGREALSLARRATADVALVDLRLPDMSGDELCRELCTLSPSISVVILSSYLSEETVRKSLRAGASAYVTKSAGVPKLIEVLDDIRADPGKRLDVHSAPQLVKQLDDFVAEQQGVFHVTPQQEQILELAAEGMTNRGIGEQLYVSESTVRFHIQKLKKRFGARTRAELVARAIRLGLIAPASEDLATANPQ